MNLTYPEFRQIRQWIYRNARPVDFARWQFHFEDGGHEAVLKGLAAFQNEDGGFGHALEADSWNPHSTPMQTANAVEVLHEIGFKDRNHPVIEGILRYLDSGADMDDADTWKNVVESSNDYPHAPWWHSDSQSTSRSIYNPTAIMAGFILECADRESALYAHGLQIAKNLAALFLREPDLLMHPLICVLTMIKSIETAGLQDEFDYAALTETANRQIKDLLDRSAGDWSGYSTRPSAFIHSPQSLGYEQNAALVDKELDYLLSLRNEEGLWNPNWSWGDYELEFALSANWWKSHIAIRNLLQLRAFGRIEAE